MKGRVWHATRAALRSAVTVSSLAHFLFGCTVDPDFMRPQADTPNNWTPALSRPVPAREWASAVSVRPIEAAAWWTTFQDSLLSSLIERAVAANLDVRQATLRIAEARALRDVAVAQHWPSLSANGSYTRQRLSRKTATGAFLTKAPGLPNPSDQFQYGFDASWEVDLFGRVPSRLGTRARRPNRAVRKRASRSACLPSNRSLGNSRDRRRALSGEWPTFPGVAGRIPERSNPKLYFKSRIRASWPTCCLLRIASLCSRMHLPVY